MQTVVITLLVLSLLGVVGTLFAGMVGLVRDDAGGGARSNALMRWRVMLQGLALGLFALLLLMGRH